MKRLLLVFCCALFLSTAGPLPAVPAQEAPAPTAEHKSKWHWFHHGDKHHENSTSSQSTHKSHGWWHHRGAGSATAGVTNQASGQGLRGANITPFPKTVGHWHNRGPGPAGAGAD